MIESSHYFDTNSRISPPAMIGNTIELEMEMINQMRYISCCIMILNHKIGT